MDSKFSNIPSLEDAQILSDEMMEQLENGEGTQCEPGCQEACKKSCKQSQRGDNTISPTVSVPIGVTKTPGNN